MRKKVKNIFLLLNGNFAKSQILPSKKDFVIAVDGGVKHYKNLGRKPDFFIGDFDSFPQKYKKLLLSASQKNKIIKFEVHKDFTDLQLALEFIEKIFEADILHFIGAFGGELDQEYGNIFLLKNQKKPIIVWGFKQNIIFLPPNYLLELRQNKSQNFSLLAFEEINNLFYQGVFYRNKEKLDIKAFSSQAMRNKTTVKKTQISWQMGQGLIFSAKKSKINIKKIIK